jgi:hypothetical protein
MTEKTGMRELSTERVVDADLTNLRVSPSMSNGSGKNTLKKGAEFLTKAVHLFPPNHLSSILCPRLRWLPCHGMIVLYRLDTQPFCNPGNAWL